MWRIWKSPGAGGHGTVFAVSLPACGSDGPTRRPGTDSTADCYRHAETRPESLLISIEVGDTCLSLTTKCALHCRRGLGSRPFRCPWLNAVGVLAPFEIHPSSPFLTAKTCDYHIPRGPAVLFSGRIVVR